MIVSTRSKWNENDDHCDDHVTTSMIDSNKLKEPFQETCAVTVVHVLFTVIDSPREMYKFLLFRLWLILLKHNFHNETIKIVLNSSE